MLSVFISYRREDSADITGRLFDHLQAHFGTDKVFMDVDTIPIGVDFREHLAQAVDRCDVLLAVIGDHWLGAQFDKGSRAGKRRLDDPADFVRIEIEAALRRGIPVIPVLTGKAQMPAADLLPETLGDLAFRNGAELRSGRDFRSHVERLIRGLEALKGQQKQKALPLVARPVPVPVAVTPPAVPAPFNLRFRQTDGAGQPVGWFDSRGFVSGVSTAYTARVEVRTDTVGGQSLLLHREGAGSREFGSWMQRCPAGPFLGKRIKLAARLCVADVKVFAGIWLRVDGPDGHLFFDNMAKRALRGTERWGIHSIECEVAPPAMWLNYGVILSGDGSLWADDVRIMFQDAATRMWTVGCSG